MLKGKVCWVEADELKRILDVDLSDFKKDQVTDVYDSLEEYVLEQGFDTWDEPLIWEGEVTNNRYLEWRWNIIIVKGTMREDKFIVNAIGISYEHIKKTKMNDLEKLVYARNHLRIPAINGKPEEDSLKAWKYLDEYIAKMRELGVDNVKDLLK